MTEKTESLLAWELRLVLELYRVGTLLLASQGIFFFYGGIPMNKFLLGWNSHEELFTAIWTMKPGTGISSYLKISYKAERGE